MCWLDTGPAECTFYRHRSPWWPSSADWHLVRSVAVCSVFLVLAEISIPPLIFALRRDDPSEGCGAMCSRVCIVGKGHHPDDRRRQLACDIWPRRFCQCDTRAFLLTTFSVLIQFCFLLLFCRIIRFSSVCFGFFRLLCFLHFWLNYCKKNKHCQTGSDTLQPFVPIG